MGLKAFYNSQPSSARCGSGPNTQFGSNCEDHLRFVAQLFDSSLQNIYFDLQFIFTIFLFSFGPQHYMSFLQNIARSLKL